MTVKLITHDRVVHADDAFAAAMLRIVYGDVEVVRTREPAILKAEAGKPGVFFLDVGGRYDHAHRLYDHHQPAGAGWRQPAERRWPYATAGLVWKHYGYQVVQAMHSGLQPDEVFEVVDFVDETVIKFIDAVDCGVRLKSAGPSISGVIASFNTSWFEQDREVFPLVMDLAQVILGNVITRQVGVVAARTEVRNAPRVHAGRVLVLEKCMPWTSVVAEEFPDVLCAIYPVPDAGGASWQIRTAVNEDMSARMVLPRPWAGLDHGELAAISKVSDAIFCHRNGHLAGAGSQAGALQLAQRALDAALVVEPRLAQLA